MKMLQVMGTLEACPLVAGLLGGKCSVADFRTADHGHDRQQ
jgi:hypothetical protein